jgi:hypothetical protein
MRRKEGGKEGMPTVHVVIFLSFPISTDYPRDSTPTLYIHVHVHCGRGCWCCYGQMGIGMGRVDGMTPDLSVGVDIDEYCCIAVVPFASLLRP